MGHPDDGPATAPTLTLEAPASTAAGAAKGDRAEHLGRYRVAARLGEGGMGVVFRAVDPELHRTVAIKLVHGHRGEAGSARVLREAQAMARLHHPNVVPVFDVGMHGGRVYVVMPLLEGGTLASWMRAERRSWRAVVERFVAAGRGLAAAHAAGLVHRDFKPDNVLLGAGGEVQVADFGIARVAGADDDEPAGDDGEDPPRAPLTQHGALLGTPAYMAPEQVEGTAVGPAADQFSFCAALFEGVYGERPFPEIDTPHDLPTLRAALRAARRRPPPDGGGGPRWLRAAILRGLRDDPAARWPSMPALLDELQRGLRRRRRIAARAIAATAIAAASALLVLAGGGEAPPTAPPASWSERPVTFRSDVGAASLSPDGATVAFVSRGELMLVPAAGGEPRALARGFARHVMVPQLVWSPDGTRLLVTTIDVPEMRRHTTLYDVASGAATPLGFLPLPLQAFVGPDEIVSAAPVRRVLVFDRLDGSTRRECVFDGEFQWVSGLAVIDETIYVSVKSAAGQRSLLAIERGCGRRRVVVAPMAAEAFLPQPGGRVLAVVGPEPLAVVEVDADGGHVGRSRSLPLGANQVVGVQPGGGFVLARQSVTWRLLEHGGGDWRELARGTSVPTLALAPDGRRLAVVENPRADAEALYLASVDALDDRSRTVAADVLHAAWSPDGERLAALVLRGDEVRVVTIELPGGAQRDLGVTDASRQGQVTWLDDRRVAYNRPDHRAYRWVDRVDGSRGDLIDPEPGWAFELARSPADGTYALYWNRRPNAGLWLQPPDGEPRLMEPSLGERAAPHAWSPDGRTWWFAAGPRIERYDAVTGARATVETLDLEPTAFIRQLLPLDNERALVQVVNITADLVLYAAP